MFVADDESSLSAASQPGTGSKKSYVPRRLLIGNDEYVTPVFLSDIYSSQFLGFC